VTKRKAFLVLFPWLRWLIKSHPLKPVVTRLHDCERAGCHVGRLPQVAEVAETGGADGTVRESVGRTAEEARRC
jgi:hypothetical protein